MALSLSLSVPSAAFAAPAADQTRPRWKQRIDAIVDGRPVGISVFHGGIQIYGHDETRLRIPASNEKLLLSMPLLDMAGPDRRFETIAASAVSPERVLAGDLWVLGGGDPTLTAGGPFGRGLPFRPTRIGALARRIEAAGIARIRGRIVGSTAYFERDWFAPGWKSSFPREEVPLPSALTYEGNVVRGKHIENPEVLVARALTRRLESSGIAVTGRPASGVPPAAVTHAVAATRSAPLSSLLRFTNKQSSNFFAEMLGKSLGVEVFGVPGTIAAGARAIEQWAADSNVTLDAYDSSGLSYANRVAPRAIARLLALSDRSEWGAELRKTLPAPGQGTLEDRLGAVRVRAKTGTLDEVSTLSGFVYLERAGRWAHFAIMSGGLAKATAVEMEDAIVRILARRAA